MDTATAQHHYAQALPSGDTSQHYAQTQPTAQQPPSSAGSQPSPTAVQQSQQQWSSAAPHLLQPGHSASPFHSPSTSSTTLVDQSFSSGFYHGQPTQSSMGDTSMERNSSLSLNISTLSVTSPTNLSPITPSPHPSTASTTLSPITPLSPSSVNTTPQQHAFPTHTSSHPYSRAPPTNASMFAFAPPDQGVRYDQTQFDVNMQRSTTSSRSSSSSEKSIPRKRSFTSGSGQLPVSMEESVYDSVTTPMDLNTPASYEEVEMGYHGMDSQGSPVEGNSSGGEPDDPFKQMGHQMSSGNTNDIAQNVGLTGKTTGTNNFVTKLYQMINDPKSSHFISWTELGTSFVVSNVGEFSRTILGSHFKHNNFSSFVRQLNMYGFHKINRTPRAQRTSADAQTWEFSHHKFLRGRPDLLEEIKRKALEPDPSIKHRVELPGEVAAQLNQMRDVNKRVLKALELEKAKVDRLTSVTKALHDLISKAYPGQLPPFPSELWEANENPPIFITSPTSTTAQSRFPSMSLITASMHNLHSMSPGSSPTAADFPSHPHSAHPLSRTHSLQHIPYDGGYGHGVATTRYDNALQTPLPPSPGSLDSFNTDSSDRKRQRTGAPSISSTPGGPVGVADANSSKRLSRARSDSAPLGYGIGQAWSQNRPRSGSGLAPRRREDMMPNISNPVPRGMTNGLHTPMLGATSPMVKAPQ